MRLKLQTVEHMVVLARVLKTRSRAAQSGSARRDAKGLLTLFFLLSLVHFDHYM